MVLALVAFAPQAVAGTLSWCLHGGDDSHVTSAVEPCHTAGQDAASGGDVVPGAPHEASHPPCHHAAPHAGTTHVAAATEAASATGPASTVAPFVVAWQGPAPAARLAASPVVPGAAGARRVADTLARPRLCGAVAGDSSRLLI
jgi:hypothetical protein